MNFNHGLILLLSLNLGFCMPITQTTGPELMDLVNTFIKEENLNDLCVLEKNLKDLKKNGSKQTEPN